MKLYFHLVLNETKEHGKITAVLNFEEKDWEIKDALESICEKITHKKNIKISSTELQVKYGKRVFSSETKLSVLENGADLDVTIKDSVCNGTTRYERTMINANKDSPKPSNSKMLPKREEDKNDSEDLKAALRKASSQLSKKRHDLAMQFYLDVLKISPNNYEGLFGVAYIYYKAQRYASSIPYFETLVNKDPYNFTTLLDYGRALTRSGDHQKSVSVLSRCINDLKRSEKSQASMVHDANVALGEAFEAIGEVQAAFQLFLNVAQMTEKQHVHALLGYIRVGYKLKQVNLDDVFIVLLNAIATLKGNADVKKLMFDMVKEKGGMDSLKKQMHSAWTDAAAVVYIANYLRETGALNESMQLMDHAYSLAPKSVDIVLLKAHIFENMSDIDGMLSFAAEFFEAKLDRQVVRKIDLSIISKVIRKLKSESKEEFDSFVETQLHGVKEIPEPLPKGNMMEVELQLLALYFTVVKVLYVIGVLKPIPLCLDVLDPLFRMNKNLHKTLIRNEQAYYSCISQIFEDAPPQEPVSSIQKIYLVGDSHVLPLAWKRFHAKNTEMCFNPLLLTGLKIWHLRKDSKFYTKVHYEKTIQTIPNGSTCVFVLGEIDSREGIPYSVEKYIYDSLEESIKAILKIYIKILTDLQQQKKLKIFVHPVPPVLTETRTVVNKFNELLKEKVSKCSKLHWLDFLGELTNKEDGSLKKEYEFDGVHLNPSYITVLEESLMKFL